MAYQTFPWQSGDSSSFEKLVSLYLPALKGKSVLDVGCNTGYFCGWAAFQQADRVKGIDYSQEAIQQAKSIFPNCSFICTAWDEWEARETEQFDVILCLSAIHYAADQKKLLDSLMRRVASGGLLVLELGVAPGEADEFVSIKRSIDTRQFPTRKKLHSMLEGYAYKVIGESVRQAGDPIPRYVYHIFHELPVAVLLMGGHYTGKTSVAKKLLNPNLFTISGDHTYYAIAAGSIAASPGLKSAIQQQPESGYINCAAATQAICESGYLPELATLFLNLARGRNFALDHFIPESYRNTLLGYMRDAGYFVTELGTDSSRAPGNWTMQHPPVKQYRRYIEHLEKQGLIDEEAYLEANPDVAQAIADKQMPNAQFHYFHFGRHEGRKLKKD